MLRGLRRRYPSGNLRTDVERIIRRAGLQPWPRLWVALRSSCETDLASAFPAHVVQRWLGHSACIADEHYLLITEADWRRAAAFQPAPEALQEALEQTAATSGTQRQPPSAKGAIAAVFR